MNQDNSMKKVVFGRYQMSFEVSAKRYSFRVSEEEYESNKYSLVRADLEKAATEVFKKHFGERKMSGQNKLTWQQPLSGFAFMMDLSKIPREKRLEIVRRLQESQQKIVPLTVD